MLAEFESGCSYPQNVLSTWSVRGILLKWVNFGALSDTFEVKLK